MGPNGAYFYYIYIYTTLPLFWHKSLFFYSIGSIPWSFHHFFNLFSYLKCCFLWFYFRLNWLTQFLWKKKIHMHLYFQTASCLELHPLHIRFISIFPVLYKLSHAIFLFINPVLVLYFLPKYEGAILSDGKGLSNWDIFTHNNGTNSWFTLSRSTSATN